MKDILNARIKHREAFRPFAPSVLEERQSEIFEHSHPSPFMLHVYKIRPEWRERLSAVNHVDDTGRLQTVAREENPLYYDLITAFERPDRHPRGAQHELQRERADREHARRGDRLLPAHEDGRARDRTVLLHARARSSAGAMSAWRGSPSPLSMAIRWSGRSRASCSSPAATPFPHGRGGRSTRAVGDFPARAAVASLAPSPGPAAAPLPLLQRAGPARRPAFVTFDKSIGVSGAAASRGSRVSFARAGCCAGAARSRATATSTSASTSRIASPARTSTSIATFRRAGGSSRTTLPARLRAPRPRRPRGSLRRRSLVRDRRLPPRVPRPPDHRRLPDAGDRGRRRRVVADRLAGVHRARDLLRHGLRVPAQSDLSARPRQR